MSDESVSGSRNNSEAGVVAEPAHSYKTSLSHSLLALVGCSFVGFEVVFITLYLCDCWLSLDIQWLGVPALLMVVAASHFFLLFLESDRGCRVYSFLFKGKPPVCYKRWISVDDDGVSYGLKRVVWDAVEELEQTWFGNLVIKSRTVCGAGAFAPDVVIKFPFTAADPESRKDFIERVKRRCPAVVLNKRLEKGLESLITSGAKYTQLMTAGFMALVLLDLGYGSFFYLEVLKEYFLAEVNAKEGRTQQSEEHLARADYLRGHPLPVSWLSRRFFLDATANAADIDETRAMVYFYLGKYKEAVEETRKAVEKSPKVLRRELRLARLLADSGHVEEAVASLGKTLEDHDSALLARLYLLSLLKEQKLEPELLRKRYAEHLDLCFQTTLGQEPHWPPVKGDVFFHELIYSSDLRFVMDRLLDLRPGDPNKDWYKVPDDVKTERPWL